MKFKFLKYVHLLAIAAGFFILAGLVHAQEGDTDLNLTDSEIIVQKKAAGPDTSALMNLYKWRQYRQTGEKFMLEGLEDRGVAYAESSLVRTRALGLALPAMGIYWDNRARQALSNKDLEKAKTFSRLSQWADGYSFKNVFTQFQINSKTNGLQSALGQFIQTILSYRQDFRFGYRALWLFVFWFSLVLMLGSLIYMMLLAVKYLPLIFHLLTDFLTKSWPWLGRMFLVSSLGISVLLVVGGISVALAIVISAILSLAMAKPREKVLFWLSMIFIGCAVMGFTVVQRFFDISYQGRLSALALANTSEWDTTLVRNLTEQQRKNQTDLKPVFALSLLEKNRGRIDRAAYYLDAVIEASDKNAYALNNKGNMFYYQGTVDSAMLYYQRAGEADGQMAEVHYNLGQALFNKIELKQGRAELEKAASLAPARIEQMTRQTGGNIVLDAGLDAKVLWPEVWKDISPVASLSPAEYSTLTGISLWLPIWVWLILFVGGIAWMMTAPKNLGIRQCSICRCSICNRCRYISPEGSEYCPDCNQQMSLVQSSDLKRTTEEILVRQSQRRRTIINAIVTFLLPGWSFMRQGRTVKVWFYAMLWGIILASLAFINAPWIKFRLDFTTPVFCWWLAGIAALILYLASWANYYSYLKSSGDKNGA